MKASATVAVARCGDRDVVVDQRAAAPLSVRQCGRTDPARLVGGRAGGRRRSRAWPSTSVRVRGPRSARWRRAWCGQASTVPVVDDDDVRGRSPAPISICGSNRRSRWPARVTAPSTKIRLGRDATCRVVEEAVLGRHGRSVGTSRPVVAVERGGRPSSTTTSGSVRTSQAHGARCRSGGRATSCRRCS